MYRYYDQLPNLYKGLIHMALGLIVLLYIMNALAAWLAIIAACALIVHGFVYAGFYDKLQAMNKKR